MISEEAEPREEIMITPTMAGTAIPVAGGGFRIILKNAKIHAEKVIIKPLKKGEKP